MNNLKNSFSEMFCLKPSITFRPLGRFREGFVRKLIGVLRQFIYEISFLNHSTVCNLKENRPHGAKGYDTYVHTDILKIRDE